MPKANKDDVARPRPRFSTLLPSEHLRRTAVEAGRELDVEQEDSVVSIARVLDEINEVENRTDLQARILLLEEQLDRLNARRDEVDQSLQSQLNVMKTTLDGALEAIASLALPAPSPALPLEVLDELRREFDEKLMQVREQLRTEMVNFLAEQAALPAEDDFEEIRENFQSRMDACDERTARWGAYLEEMIGAVAARLEDQKLRHADVVSRLSAELSSFADALAGSTGQPAR